MKLDDYKKYIENEKYEFIEPMIEFFTRDIILEKFENQCKKYTLDALNEIWSVTGALLRKYEKVKTIELTDNDLQYIVDKYNELLKKYNVNYDL